MLVCQKTNTKTHTLCENVDVFSHQSSEASISKQRSRASSGTGSGSSFSRLTLSVLWKLCAASALCLVEERLSRPLRSAPFWGGFFWGGFFLGGGCGAAAKASESGWRPDLEVPAAFFSV